jgi:IPT/TIG domain
MAKNPSFWSRLNVLSWFGTDRETHRRADRKRTRVARRVPFESLEERDLLTVVVDVTTTSIFQDVPAIVIHGSGFDPIVANNSVAFNDGVGTVTGATDTELTVEFSTPPSEAGVLTAVVTTTTENSGSPVQVATVVPTVTASSEALAADASSIYIFGTGFDTQFAHNVVNFNNGAEGTAIASTGTRLTVSITTPPTVAGPLTAEVVTNSVSSGANVRVATVVPVVTASSVSLAANATSMTINGFGFSTTETDNIIDFDGKAVGEVTAATATSLTINLTTPPKVAGDLFAIVRTNGVSSAGAVKVATVKPVATVTTANLAANASTLTIAGFGFDKIAGNNTVSFNNGAVGTVTLATSTQLTVAFSTKPTSAGSLTATVTTNSVAGTAAQVRTVVPVVTSRTVNVAANATSVTINGFGFDSVATNNTVVFNNDATGTVSAASPTSLTVDFDVKPTAAGSLTATVTSNGSNSSNVQVATVTPVVTLSTADMAANIGTVTINGFGFDSTPSNNTIVFNNGAIGTVASGDNTSLVVNLSAKPATAGPLTAVVTSGGISSGTAVQIKRITPVVTTSTTNRGADQTTLVINGFGFSPVLGNNIVSFDNSAVGAVTSATPTSITVTYSTKPVTAGDLNASVSINGISGGSAVKVATITPVVTSNSGNVIPVNASFVIITGFGFDPILLNNTVALVGGATGTVAEATPTSLKVTFGVKPPKAGLLRATVTTNTLSSNTNATVASVAPVVLANAASRVAADASTVTVVGLGFDSTFANNSIVFDSGAVGTVSAATATTLTVSLSAQPTAGNLNATVTTNGISNGASVRVGTVRPVVTASTSSLSAIANTITIRGSGFSTTAANNSVVFNNGAEGVVTAATATELTVAFLANKKPTSAGSLTAVVTSNGVNSNSAVQVATVAPVITSRISNLSPNATSVTISGFGFASTVLGNTVSFNNDAEGTISSATATSLTVQFSKKPKGAGSLTATVTSNGVAGVTSNVQVASVIPLILPNTSYTLGIDAATLTINGLGFDSVTPTNNIVLFDNGAIGTVSAATGTTLTVDIGTAPTAGGNMNAFVTTNGIGSGAAVQVAKIAPLVTAVTTNLGITTTSVTITGSGFDTTASNNTVSFSNGATGTVTAATATSLTVTFSAQPTSVGALTAVVSTNGVSSGTPVQVATVIPVITSSTASLAAGATTLTINGFGFSTNAAENVVAFNNGAVGTVTASDGSSLSVTFTTIPSTVGALNATVTTNSKASTDTQVANVIPSVTSSTDALGADASSIVIKGFGFSGTATDNTVQFNNGAIGTVDSSTATSLTVTFTTKPVGVGSLTAIVTTNGIVSGSGVQVATVKPSVTSIATGLAATSDSVTIAGFGFSTTPEDNTVVFNNGAEGTVTAATATQLTVAFTTNKKPTTAGSLTAVVTTNSHISGTPVQVATVTPVATESTANLAADASSITINGFGFDLTPSRNTIDFNNNAVGTVTDSTATRLTVSFTTKPRSGGSLTATVRTNGVASGTAPQVATIIPVVVANSSLKLAANAGTLVINGSGFDPVALNNVVTFNNGALGTVTSATSTSLTVTFDTKPTSAGSLTAFVTTNGAVSGSPVQVAAVAPVVTSSATSLAANAATVSIAGFGFDPTATNNTVVFSNGAEGTVTTATPTLLTVTFSDGKQPTVGSLTAIVTSNSVSSGTAIQTASVIPVVTSSTANLGINASSIEINGFGFDTTASRNVVTFNNGATGSVTNATSTRLTVTYTNKPTAVGSLTASVATNSVSTASSLQVATIIPVITSSTVNVGVNDTTMTISGFGFDSTSSNNVVTLSTGTGTVTSSTSTSLTVTFGTKPTAGNLTAFVTTNSLSSGTPVQVGTVKPVVTNVTTSMNANAATVTISGFGFDTTPGNNTVVFSSGAEGTVTTATSTLLTVTFADNKKPAAGSLTARVTTNSISSGTSVQIASVVPIITSSTAGLGINSTTIDINGIGFDSIGSRNLVTFNNGATGTVTNATPTRLTVTFGTKPSAVGVLTATVTTNSIASSSSIQVANVIGVITSSTTSKGADESTLTINGFGFDTTASNNVVTLSSGAGTVTNATATTLTVALSTLPKAGNLTAIVTTQSVSSVTPVQVATIKPIVTTSVANLGFNSDTVTINGFGFDLTPTNNTVAFNLGATGSVTGSTATSLTVRFGTKPTSLGNLTAIVTTNGVNSGSALAVAKMVPVVTSNTANVALNATTLTINGFGFDSTTPGNNTVEFNNGVTGTVTGATATTLTVTFSGILTAGNLTAIVTRGGISSGTAVQVGSLKPTVTTAASEVAASSTTITISGAGFSTTAANNTVVFSSGAVGTVTNATATALTVSVSVQPVAGALTAVVTTNGGSSGTPVQIAMVNPVVTSSTTALALNGTSLTINGFGFSTTIADNSVVLSGGAVGAITAATTTSLTLNLTTKPSAVGSLTGRVTTKTRQSEAGVQVAQVVANALTPSVTANTSSTQAADVSTVTIAGTNFSTTPGNNLVKFSSGAVGTVSAATATSLTVSFSTKPRAGVLTAIVTTNGISSGTAIQITSVTPVVTASTANLSASETTLTINGIGFDTVAGNNTVALSNGAVGSVTAATATTLTVTIGTRATSVGSITAVVTTNSKTSGSPVQVARILPGVTLSTATLPINATSITINGFAFDTTASNNTVTFNNGAVGTVTSATATALTVSIGTRPTSFGSLTASVTTNSISSGAPIQVATARPAVTTSSSNQNADVSTITIAGDGFDTTAANNSVVFSSGAVGTITSATATSLSVSFSTKPAAGILTVVVTTNGTNSGNPIQVANIVPVITSSTAGLSPNASSVTINGFGFDTTLLTRNVVTFNNGAAGTVSAATGTSLTVTFGTKPAAVGSLTAQVTTNGVSNGSSIQVATVVPTITANTTNLTAAQDTLLVAGFGFDRTAANNSITLNLGAVGRITAATATQLTVSLTTRPTSQGNLTAVVTTNSVSSGDPVQVGSVRPTVTQSTASLALTATTLVIAGTRFDSTAANNTVTFNNGAIGTVTSATATSLTVNFSTRASAGNLTVVVTTNGVSTEAPVQVATISPTVTLSTTNLAANANTITIAGSGFDTTASRNIVTFNNGAAGTVASASSTSLTVTLTTKPTTAGSLTASVTVNGASSGTAVQVANVTPVVTTSTATLSAGAASVVINGFGFDPTFARNTVVFNNGAAGTVTAATANSLTVRIDTKPTAVGSLTAVVTTNSNSSGSPVQIANVTPSVTASTTAITGSTTSITIRGFGFSSTAANNTVLFNNGAVGNVTAATATTLTVSLTTPPTAGNLTAVVTTSSLSSGTPVQVATLAPTITSSTANLPANSTTVTIAGTGFDTTALNNSVTFSSGSGTVTNATSTALTVTFSTPPSAGNLTAIVTTNGAASGTTGVQVGAVKPMVTLSTTNVARTAATIVINGYGFSSTPGNNIVTFNNGATGTVTAATPTRLTVTFGTKTTLTGSLTAVIVSNGVSSVTPVQVANMT